MIWIEAAKLYPAVAPNRSPVVVHVMDFLFGFHKAESVLEASGAEEPWRNDKLAGAINKSDLARIRYGAMGFTGPNVYRRNAV